MSKNYEKILPEGYNEIFHIDAKNKKTGLVFTLFSLVLTILPLAILLLIYFCTKEFEFELSYKTSLYLLALAIAMILYIVLHELVHGIAYKALTKQKLTFGISWSCAYCGVPNIYVYRKASMIALIAPFTVFSLLFGSLVIWFYFLDGALFFLMSLLFSIHVGGCVGDLYMFTLFLFKYKDKILLMKDTGPEQFLYQKTE
ncbi:MAG: DUF3267 domain-containing protein [Roseburia sp.]|nr:DUF3267 domain-containing protein [Anaeroplasma bactoclasticum]MCM1196586.1 DUF3267 domain-containing protein [Roseburia sp.]MCM1557221.1 DUF3267 domain-containing protein [Anaeroplasma bactoclasticum]